MPLKKRISPTMAEMPNIHTAKKMHGAHVACMIGHSHELQYGLQPNAKTKQANKKKATCTGERERQRQRLVNHDDDAITCDAPAVGVLKAAVHQPSLEWYQ